MRALHDTALGCITIIIIIIMIIIIDSDHHIAFVSSAIVLSLVYLSDLPTALCSSAIISSLVFIILSIVRMIYKMKSKWYLTAATITATLIMMVMVL